LSVLDVMLWHHRLGYEIFNKMVSKKILCVEESVHVLFDESNSLVQNDAQDEDVELGLTKKYSLLTHEEGKNPQEGSGPDPGSKEERHGDKQAGGNSC